MMRYSLNILLLLIYLIPTKIVFGQSESLLRYVEKNEIGNLNPYLNPMVDATSDRFFALIFETLYRYNHELGQYIPVLADGNIQKVNETTIRIQLKNNVFWHDGRRFTASDVVFSYDYATEISRNIALREFIASKILGVRAINNLLVEFQFTEPSDAFEGFLNQWIIPAHKFDGTPTSLAAFSREPIGTGPYKFERLRVNNYTIAKFDRYYGEIPKIQNINMTTQRDVDSAVRQLLARITDMLIELPPDQIENIEQRRTHRLEPYQSFSISTITFNFSNELLQNNNVRRAMTYGFNRQRVLEQWYNNRGNVLAGPYTRSAPYYNPDLQPIPYDVNQANQLLRQAGFTARSSDGILSHSNGKRLSFRLMVKVGGGQGTDIHQNIAEDFRRAMREIGIHIELVFMQDDDFRTTVLESKNYDLAFVEWFFDPFYSIRLLFHSNGIYNINNYRNTVVDNLFNQLDNRDVASQPEAQQQIQYRLQAVLAQDLPTMFLHNVDRYAVIDNKFVNTIIDPFYFFFDIAKWEILNIYD